MPNLNEHAARLTEPSKYKSFARKNNIEKGIDFIYGILPDGKTEVQSIRCNAEIFTPETAKKWIEEHDMKIATFEEAIKKSIEKEPFTVDLIVKSSFESNGRFYHELGYMLDGTLGSDPRNLVAFDSPADSEVAFQKGAIVQVLASGIEPFPYFKSGKFGISILNPEIIAVSSERKLPETAKAIIQKAEYYNCLLASEFLQSELSEIGILKRQPQRKFSFETDKDNTILKYEFPICKDAKKQIVYGVIYEPFDGTNADAHGDYASAEDIEKAAHGFMEEYQAINLMHESPLYNNDVKICESFIAPTDFYVGGQMIKKGSWVMATHVVNKELWKMIEDGVLNAYSMEGTGKTSDFFKSYNGQADKNISKRCLFDMLIKAVALVDRGANKKKFYLMKRDNNIMDKNTLINLIKSGKLTVEQAENFGTTLGFKDADLAEIKKAAEVPATTITLETITAAIAKSQQETSAAIIKAIEGLVEKVTEGNMAPGGDQKTDAQPPEGASEEEKVKWYLTHPDAQIPENLMDAVATALAQKKAEEMQNS